MRWIRVSAVLLLLFAALAPRARADDAPACFADQAILDKHLPEACAAVEAVTGQPFKTRPTVRVSDAKTVGDILAKEFESFPEAVVPAASRDKLAHDMAKFLMAKYEPATHVIHVIPETVDLIHKLQPELPPLCEDHLRILLAHEVTHAHDFERYGFVAMRPLRKTPDEHQGLNAVIEGHAQYVAHQVAKRWGLLAAYDRLTLAIVGTDDEEGTPVQRAMRAAALANIRFAYAQGNTFFEAVAKARGAEGVIAALRKPPMSSREIEEPARWLDPSSVEKEPDLAALLEAAHPLAGAEGWAVSKSRILEGALRGMALRLPKERRAEFLRGYRDGHLLQAVHAKAGIRAVVALLLFDTEEHAKLAVEHDRIMAEHPEVPPGAHMETKDLSDGVGKDRKIPGFTMHRVLTMGANTTDLRQAIFHAGHFVAETLIIEGARLRSDEIDAVLAHLYAVLLDPTSLATRRAPKAVEILPEKTLEVGTPGTQDPEAKDPEAKDDPKTPDKKSSKQPAPAGAGK